MENSLCYDLSYNEMIAIKFYLCTTAVLSWNVQNFVAMWYPVIELRRNQLSIAFELRSKIVRELSPRLHACFV